MRQFSSVAALTEALATAGVPLHACPRAFSVSTVFLEGHPGGMRLIKSCGSRLSLITAPFKALERIKACLSPWQYVAYVIDDPLFVANGTTYIGHGDGERDFGDRLGDATANMQIYVIIADEETFDKFTTTYLESRLIRICTELNIPLINGGRPFGRSLTIRDDLEQLVGHAEMLLFAAGFARIHLARMRPPEQCRRLSVTADLDEMVAMTDDEKAIVTAEGEAYRLAWRDLQVVAYEWNDRFYLIDGSDYASRTRTSLSHDHRGRRELLEAHGWVGPRIDAPDKMTVKLGFSCRSGAFAAKILSGEKLDEKHWVAVESSPSADYGDLA